MQLRRLPFPAEDSEEPRCRIFALGEDGKWPVADFLAQAAEDHVDDFSKLTALLIRSAEHGLPSNKQKVRQLKGCGGLKEFKAGCLRLFFFHDKGRLVICTHGIVKKSQQTPQKDLKTATRRMKAYKAASKRNQVTIIEP
ncbi:type II toxin-antitoxin system RelE/ParE family toxin [Haloferula sp. A504]|uniref:type II toxin-antitoxin system RelE/ParE family toxin n=1 Tax=Haloferula sp. A504 TaxID=3373601 RepID=UPI0031C1327F|nr:type II toxin-antitoxin system RelE/ParE family toxin [Verrucomicrobiaceae bacterium E54]